MTSRNEEKWNANYRALKTVDFLIGGSIIKNVASLAN